MIIDIESINTIYFKNKLNKLPYKKKCTSIYFKGIIYKTATHYEISTETVNWIISQNESKFNASFHAPFNIFCEKHFIYWHIILKSINYKTVIIMNSEGKIIDFYYKILFMNKQNKNIVYRINQFSAIKDFNSKEYENINALKHNVIYYLFNIELDTEFVFDKNGLNLIEMMIC